MSLLDSMSDRFRQNAIVRRLDANGALEKLAATREPIAPCRQCSRTARELFSITKVLPSWVIHFDSSSCLESCPFCRLLRSVLRKSDQPQSPRFLLSLKNEATGREDCYRAGAQYSNELAKAFIHGTKSNNHISRAPPQLNVNMVRNWMKTCAQEHQGCGQITWESTPTLRLIDCKSRKLVSSLSNPHYATLSYVWGKDSKPPKFDTHLPPLGSLPSTLEDSIYLTMQLGYKYLWVDRYCINQQDAKDTYEQCQQMDKIYAYSDITIIAAAGVGPDHGLPGIGTSLRSQCATMKLSHNKVMLCTMEPWDLIKDSHWNTRGWTYQEQYLSKRRLFFTDAQVFFECGSSSIAESEAPVWREQSPLSLSGTNADYYFQEEVTSSLPWSIMDCIRRYAARDLTQANDVLRAFQGILNLFSKAAIPVHNCWGVPLYDPALVFGDRPPQTGSVTYSQLFCVGLAFETKIPVRRLGFPSWSWAGWHGEISWHYMARGAAVQDQIVEGIDVQIELMSGEVVALSSFLQLCAADAGQHQASQFIRLTSWSVPVSVCKVGLSDYLLPYQRQFYADMNAAYEWEGRIEERSGGDIRFRLRFPERTHLDNASCVGIYVGSWPAESQLVRGPILLICHKREGSYERLGSVDLIHFDRYDANGEKIVHSLVDRHLPAEIPDLVRSWETFRIC